MSWKTTIVEITTTIITITKTTKITKITTKITTTTITIITTITTITTINNKISQTQLIGTKEFVSKRKKVATKSVLSGFVATFIIIK
ncbi:hypothetical protein [Clostridium sp. UBA4395]|uniref:hypothetical protein n=1 Tax=Clostridium sp. UBA4395 TaxID=1946360 RepID=UPI003217FCDC